MIVIFAVIVTVMIFTVNGIGYNGSNRGTAVEMFFLRGGGMYLRTNKIL